MDWLRAGSQMVQQQALRDFDQAMRNYFGGTHRRPSFRKAGRSEGFRVVAVKLGHVRRLNRRAGEVWVPKGGLGAVPLVPSRSWSEVVQDDLRSSWALACRVRLHPGGSPGAGTGQIVGVDRGVVVSAALSTGELLSAPRLSPGQRRRLLLLQRRAGAGQPRLESPRQVQLAIARLRAREADARKDWCEKISTDLARRFAVIRVEDLNIREMSRSAGGTDR